MTNNDWQKVREVFDSALCRPLEERRSYIAGVCGGDKNLFAEVESLLVSLDSAESFMETPAVTKVAGIIAVERKKVERGKCFGHFEIIKQIGAGGMGEVYLAQDQKLDRHVAIKILNEKFSGQESNLQRFVSEAKAASALNHPNILTIHEVGEAEEAHYIVSEFIKGETLRQIIRTVRGNGIVVGRNQSTEMADDDPHVTAGGSHSQILSLAKILDIAIQVANALCAAHEAHLVHCDIKPENIMIRPDGYVKILDFGLAKLVEQKHISFLGLEESILKHDQTAKGMIVGTVNYMSPEQANGERVDERTDVFSFGAVLYEMIAGRTPFATDSVLETIANLINQEPPPLSQFAADVPDGLTRIVARMLCKNKDGRFQTMNDVLADLKDLRENLTFDEVAETSYSPQGGNANAILQRKAGYANNENSFSQQMKTPKSLAGMALLALLAGAIGLGYYFFYARKTALGADRKRSIAVLPLKPVNTANRDELYEFGIAEALIFKLSSAKGLDVRPLSATRRYSNIEQDAIAAGREQKADFVLASNYQIADGRIRITAQLVNVQSGLVEEVFKVEHENSGIFFVQDAVAASIGLSLLVKLNREPNNLLVKRYTTNEEAYRLYILGAAMADKRNNEDVRKAIDYFEQAVRLDPNYALAYARLASALIARGATQEQYAKARTAIGKALAIDDNLAEAHSFSGEIKSDFEGDFAGAEREHLRAIELNPSSSVVHRMYALLLTQFGRHDESIAEIKTAIDLEPASVVNHLVLGRSLLFARRYDESVTELKRTAEMGPEYFFALQSLSAAYRFMGDYDRAFEYLIEAWTLAGDKPNEINSWKTTYAKSGWSGVLTRQLQEARADEKDGKPNYVQLANLSSELGQRDQAFTYLEKAIAQQKVLTMLKVHPRFDSLRDDPRYDELVRRVGLR